MKIFDHMKERNWEQIIFCHDGETGLQAIIAIHDTSLGPALGGTRMRTYPSEDHAILDVLRLSRGMTYKAAVAGLPLGGGKGVIIGSPAQKTPKLLRAYGKFIDTLNGRYITAEDMGTCQQDMDIIYEATRHVVGRSPALGGSGDPGPFTAEGVLHGIRAAVKQNCGSSDLKGLKIAVQGVGNVGYHLCRLLVNNGAHVFAADSNSKAIERAVSELGVIAVSPDKIYDIECDVFSPCAQGAIVNDQTISRFKCSIIAGSANNVLSEDRCGKELLNRGILYVPDYVINAGGLINVAGEVFGYTKQDVNRRLKQIYKTTLDILAISDRKCIPTSTAADFFAEKIISEQAALKNKEDKRDV